MKINRTLALLGAMVFICSCVHVSPAQTQNLPAELRRAPRSPDEAAYRQLQIQRVMDAQARTAMRRAEDEARASAKRPAEQMPTMSSADIKRIETLLTPHADDLSKYKSFLSQDRTGIFRMFPQTACDETRVVRVDGECANSVPGGSRYSFRAGAKTPDIHYVDGRLVAKGFFAHHLLASIGDISIDSLAPISRQLKPLADFVPETTYEGARAQSSDIENEMNLDGVKYSDHADLVVDSTYLLRIIAYKNGNNLQRRLSREGLSPNDPVWNFEKLQTDHRLDLIVAFRVIRKDSSGNITIIWKEISRKKPPVITFAENEGMADFN
ncbi:MAG: hypothetical protein ABIU09_03445 [Pyrinomonadaceae bacterium]